jgi:hypothetical protein
MQIFWGVSNLLVGGGFVNGFGGEEILLVWVEGVGGVGTNACLEFVPFPVHCLAALAAVKGDVACAACFQVLVVAAAGAFVGSLVDDVLVVSIRDGVPIRLGILALGAEGKGILVFALVADGIVGSGGLFTPQPIAKVVGGFLAPRAKRDVWFQVGVIHFLGDDRKRERATVW